MLEYLKAYMGDFMATKLGAMVGAFLRVAAAGAFSAWMAAGFPVTGLTAGDLVDYFELGVQAGAALVLVNYFAPWEKRYGTEKTAQ